MSTKDFEQFVPSIPLSFQNALHYKQLKRTGSLLLRRSIHLFLNRSRDINVRLGDKLDVSSVCGASGYCSNTKRS